MRFLWEADEGDDVARGDATPSTLAHQGLPTVLQALLSIDFLSLAEWEACSHPLDQLLADSDICGDPGACVEPGVGHEFGELAARVLQDHGAIFGYWHRKKPSK